MLNHALLSAIVVMMSLAAAAEETPYDVTAKDAKSPYYLKVEKMDETLGVEKDTEMPENYVRVVYFHRVPGCETCQMMSKYVYEIVKTKFPEEVKSKQIVLRYYDFEDPKNAKLVKAFKIGSPTLMIIQGINGKDAKAKNAKQIWPLASEKEKFFEYVEKEIRDYLPRREEE